jgi:hypothetical protein
MRNRVTRCGPLPRHLLGVEGSDRSHEFILLAVGTLIQAVPGRGDAGRR